MAKTLRWESPDQAVWYGRATEKTPIVGIVERVEDGKWLVRDDGRIFIERSLDEARMLAESLYSGWRSSLWEAVEEAANKAIEAGASEANVVAYMTHIVDMMRAFESVKIPF